jgi:lipoyl(octanoyl) transferase
MLPRPGEQGVEWQVSPGLTPYEQALARMEERADLIHKGQARELIWLVEHPPLYTAGTSTRPEDLKTPLFPVHQTGRGGQYTYHGPGQRVVYVMLDVKRLGGDLRAFVTELEDWVIAALARFQVKGERRPGRVGVWVDKGGGVETKIAAVGIRVRQWVSFHGLSINVEPDLSHFAGIVPCGISAHGVTSLVDLGLPVTLADMDLALRETVPAAFMDEDH